MQGHLDITSLPVSPSLKLTNSYLERKTMNRKADLCEPPPEDCLKYVKPLVKATCINTVSTPGDLLYGDAVTG